MSGSKILDIRELHKSFPGVRALEAVDFDLYEGEIHCLVGENGAGKSTLVEILAGNYRPDSGVIAVGQESFRELSPAKSLALGIETVHQEDQLTLSVSAAENIYMGNLPGTVVGGGGLVTTTGGGGGAGGLLPSRTSDAWICPKRSSRPHRPPPQPSRWCGPSPLRHGCN